MAPSPTEWVFTTASAMSFTNVRIWSTERPRPRSSTTSSASSRQAMSRSSTPAVNRLIRPIRLNLSH